MLLDDQLLKAINLVADLFRHETRKGTGLPYVVHLFSVYTIITKVTDDKEVQIAGLLHDVLEDIPDDKYSAEDMQRDFGRRVRQLVETVSHYEDKYGYEPSRQMYIEQIQAGPEEACIISGADLLHNSKDMLIAYEKNPDTARKYFGKNAKPRDWFYQKRLEVIKDRLGSDNILVRELEPVLVGVHDVHRAIMN